MNEQTERLTTEQMDGGAGGTATMVRPKAAPPRMDRLKPWNVLLHNDPVNTIEHVVKSLMEIVRLNTAMAVERTWEAHRRGVAVVATTHREHAELLCEQFASKKLTATAEEAG